MDSGLTLARRGRPLVAIPLLPVQAGADRHPGVNGWLSSWGTVGDMAGCPPRGGG